MVLARDNSSIGTSCMYEQINILIEIAATC